MNQLRPVLPNGPADRNLGVRIVSHEYVVMHHRLDPTGRCLPIPDFLFNGHNGGDSGVPGLRFGPPDLKEAPIGLEPDVRLPYRLPIRSINGDVDGVLAVEGIQNHPSIRCNAKHEPGDYNEDVRASLRELLTGFLDTVHQSARVIAPSDMHDPRF